MSDPSPARHPVGRRVRRILVWVVGSLGALVLLVVIGFLLWANIGVMGPEEAALAAVRDDPALTLTDEGAAWVLTPSSGESDVGLVFVPGAKVDSASYAATLAGVARQGATVVITKPPLTLAFFDLRPLGDFTDLVPGVDEWFVGGHSLGGVRACQLAEGSAGLVLFASYCANDLADTGVPVLSISGSEDGVTRRQSAEDAIALLPTDAVFVDIQGGNHAGFGAYGPQPGDNEATIPDEQIRAEIDDALAPFLFGP